MSEATCIQVNCAVGCLKLHPGGQGAHVFVYIKQM